MGCPVSKSSQEAEDDIVLLCRERKRLMKSAVNRRYALADAHFKYNQALCSVALAIRLFVGRHSSPSSSPFLNITFPESSSSPGGPTTESNPTFYQNFPFLPDTHQANPCELQDSSVKIQSCSKLERERVDGEEEDDEGEEERVMCEHFYDDVESSPIALPQNDFGWDFFNSFYGVIVNESSQREVFDGGERNVVVVGDGGGGGGGGGAEEVKTVVEAKVSQWEEDKGLMSVIDNKKNPSTGRELMEALKDVEDHFIRVYESNMDVCKLLETNVVQLQSGLEEIKESPEKIIPSITCQRSPLSRSSSSRSLLSSTSFSSSTWTGSNSDLLDEYGGMESGNHSLTLGRIYAWEKKLYDEVKAGSEMRKFYDRKSSQLSKEDENGEVCSHLEKNGDDLKDLHSRILISIKTADSISKRIEKLRDEELQPQLVALLQGLTRSWSMMEETHKTQSRTMFEVKSFTSPAFENFSNDSHRLATLQLEAAIQDWRACFSNYISTQKAYIKSLNGWISKFVSQETESVPISQPDFSVICQEWLVSLQKLPEERVRTAMKGFAKEIRSLWAHQGIEQQQKRKIDRLVSEHEKKAIAFQKTEKKVLEMKTSEKKTEMDIRNKVEYLADRKGMLEMNRKKLETEKARHGDILQEMQRVNLVGFQVGFSSVFDSLTEFSEACAKMYADLVENAKAQLKLKAEVRPNPCTESKS